MDGMHASLRAVVAEVMGAPEIVPMLNALFGLDLTDEAVLGTPTASELAGTVERAWLEGGATAEELAERVAALVLD